MFSTPTACCRRFPAWPTPGRTAAASEVYCQPVAALFSVSALGGSSDADSGGLCGGAHCRRGPRSPHRREPLDWRCMPPPTLASLFAPDKGPVPELWRTQARFDVNSTQSFPPGAPVVCPMPGCSAAPSPSFWPLLLERLVVATHATDAVHHRCVLYYRDAHVAIEVRCAYPGLRCAGSAGRRHRHFLTLTNSRQLISEKLRRQLFR